MTRLTRENVNFEWTEDCEKVFQDLKEKLTTSPMLIIPEQGRGYEVYCDASKLGLGCVLI